MNDTAKVNLLLGHNGWKWLTKQSGVFTVKLAYIVIHALKYEVLKRNTATHMGF